jgi:polyvinyl alcohol dehydrogenase (cytochrome)
MVAMSVPGRMQTFTAEQKEAVAKAFGFVTQDELKDLRRTVTSLEQTVARLRAKPNPGGIHAIDLATGERAWYVPPTDPLCAGSPQCRPSQGAATTAIPGAVFSGSLDGGMRAYSTEDGEVLWLFDTNREFETVNGVAANGGGMDAPGAIVADGMLFFNSGYGGFGRPAGNVLLAFGLAD